MNKPLKITSAWIDEQLAACEGTVDEEYLKTVINNHHRVLTELKAARANEAMSCGHALRLIYSSDEGTHHCTECAKIAQLEADNAALRKVYAAAIKIVENPDDSTFIPKNEIEQHILNELSAFVGECRERGIEPTTPPRLNYRHEPRHHRSAR